MRDHARHARLKLDFRIIDGDVYFDNFVPNYLKKSGTKHFYENNKETILTYAHFTRIYYYK
jgi:hypothetical protein